MKVLSCLIILLLIASVSKAQLANTKWRGKLNVPDETSVVLDFRKDSVDMIIVDNDMVGESMTYTIKDSTITMKKTSGHSPCNIGDEFKVKYILKGDKLFISNLSDPCSDRTQSWTTEPLIREK